jgi:hypothetical protein
VADAEPASTLVMWLSKEVVQPHMEKRLLEGYNVRLYPVLFGSEWLFAKGALLGRALSDRLEILCKMLAEPGSEREYAGKLRQAATDRVKTYGKEPDSFRDFWVKTELPQLDAVPLSDRKMVGRLSKEKCRLAELVPKLFWWVVSGIAFGATYPELTERMWKQGYETPPDAREWQISQAAGVVDGPWQPTPLEDMEHAVLLTVAYYAGEYYPELVQPLGLVQELEEGRREVESE